MFATQLLLETFVQSALWRIEQALAGDSQSPQNHDQMSESEEERVVPKKEGTTQQDDEKHGGHEEEVKEFERASHINYFKMHLDCLRWEYQALDPNRVTLLYFTVSALDVLGALDVVPKHDVVDWLYAQQVLETEETQSKCCGFRSGPWLGVPHRSDYDPSEIIEKSYRHDRGHIAMTYTALATLCICGDDFSRVNKKGIISALQHLQLDDGSFCPVYGESENDMRFVFCACAISKMLNDWSGFDIDRCVQFIVKSQSYDGGFGLRADHEGHGGSTYCAVASLALMNKLDAIADREGLLRWCVLRQGNGFRGRPNKPEDTCYSFWIGATLKLIGGYEFTCPEQNRLFNLSCQFKYGGFSKVPDTLADLLHSYMGLCGMSLMGLDELAPIDSSLGFCKRAVEVAKKNSARWTK